MRKAIVTIKDIAREAGCAPSTVSKLVNGGNVREPQRTRILELLKQYDYKPNAIAKSLRTRQSWTVGVLYPEFNNFFSMNMMSMLEAEFSSLGYSALACSSGNDAETEQKKLEFLLEKQVDGIVLMPCHTDGRRIAGVLGRENIPLVLIDRLCAGIEADAVLLNNRAVAAQATSLLLAERGSAAIIGSGDSYTGEQRYLGYVDAHRERSLPVRSELVKDGGYTIDGGYLCMKELWRRQPRPDALFVTNYEMTVGAIMAINELGIRVPEELKVVGFDNVGLARAINREILIVEQPMLRMAKTAAARLFRQMNTGKDGEPERFVLDAKIVNLEGLSERYEILTGDRHRDLILQDGAV